MAESLKKKTINGMIWTGIERIGSSSFLFISNLVLARLLSPNDFGAIAMLMVFISLSAVIVDAGFSSALIQKKESHQTDFSTIYMWNICFGLILYCVIYLSSSLVSDFYKMPELRDVLRAYGIVIPIDSLFLVHQAFLQKQLRFKMVAKINLLSVIIGTVCGIILAFAGFGVWSLVLKSLTTSISQALSYYGAKIWRPTFSFDFSRFKSLLSVGGYITLNKLVNTLYHNMVALIIGKSFSASTLGFYNQARKLEDVPRNALSSIVINVTFPVFSSINNDKERLNNAVSKCMRNLAFISFPMMIYLIVVAKSLIILLLTIKWSSSVLYFQMLCLVGCAITPIEINSNLLNALGRTKLSFNIRLFQRACGLAFIIIGMNFGMKGLLMGYVIAQYFSLIIAGIISGKEIGYGFTKQFKDIFPAVSLSIIAGCLAYFLPFFYNNIELFPLLCLQTSIFVLAYLTLSKIFHIQELNTYRQIIISKIKNIWGKRNLK